LFPQQGAEPLGAQVLSAQRRGHSSCRKGAAKASDARPEAAALQQQGSAAEGQGASAASPHRHVALWLLCAPPRSRSTFSNAITVTLTVTGRRASHIDTVSLFLTLTLPVNRVLRRRTGFVFSHLLLFASFFSFSGPSPSCRRTAFTVAMLRLRILFALLIRDSVVALTSTSKFQVHVRESPFGPLQLRRKSSWCL
jgi:hypothetical protein